ncbi:uncharacterized protein SPPG_05631 [Spizellomyces punctatus DAOM BR117]|uniref:Uncharacterized protein n=1 Tax=Spizellomyces punctatus (strain DAOM BR117) TaxID=645134 RepID=A0A0L0HE54_SPIPD|nr:uncharacterized protein SPPG_05631 [Spizellomyces punctatus DAOM BR117]KNC99387.1 hypothetical protein SPPG_05631 [Spizellomyces punctatus DAOM BR117]|eukprot:XP_016607427.1 hypothetical protein SPPG_05631 [Spizellomyces punctatus DAOM BR117]
MSVAELVKLLQQGNTDVTAYNSEQVERDVFWKEKRKWVDSKLPTGYFKHPLLNKYRSFGKVDTQFVSDPYYIEIDNRRFGELRDENGRSLNPDTFRPIVSDAELKQMREGRTRMNAPSANQETRYPINHGSEGYKNDIDLIARIRRMREGYEEFIKEEKRKELADIQRFRSSHGIHNPGESLLETTGLGTRGTDISASRDEYNMQRGVIRPTPALSENIFYEEGGTPPTQLVLHRRSESPTSGLPSLAPMDDSPSPSSSAFDFTTMQPSPRLHERRNPRESSLQEVYNPRTGNWIRKNGKVHKELKKEWASNSYKIPSSWTKEPR